MTTRNKRIILISSLVLIMGGTYWLSARGTGLTPLHDPAVQSAEKNCPASLRNANGDCPPRAYRSFFLVRGFVGGGTGVGK